MKKKLGLTALFCVMLAPACFAGDAPPPPPEGMGMGPGGPGRPMHMFKMADADGDGVITKKEFMSFHEKRFDEMDTNKDGKLSEEEIEAHRPPMRRPPSGE